MLPHLSNCATTKGTKESCDCQRLHPRRYTREVIAAYCATCGRGYGARCKKPNGAEANGPHLARRQAVNAVSA